MNTNKENKVKMRETYTGYGLIKNKERRLKTLRDKDRDKLI
jgi:hypothetical protein